jgi:hypothetical protein
MAKETRGGETGGNYLTSLKRVKRFLEKFEGRPPSDADLERITPDLQMLFDKFVKIRRSCPPASKGIDLSDDLWRLLARAGIANREIVPLRKTGSI